MKVTLKAFPNSDSTSRVTVVDGPNGISIILEKPWGVPPSEPELVSDTFDISVDRAAGLWVHKDILPELANALLDIYYRHENTGS